MGQEPHCARHCTKIQQKKTAPVLKSFQSKDKTRDDRWMQTDRGIQGSNETIPASIRGSGITTLSIQPDLQHTEIPNESPTSFMFETLH